MRKAGFAPGSTIYFDIEDGTTPTGAYQAHLLGWMAAVASSQFVPATYCSHLLNPWAAGQDIPHWCFHLLAPQSGPYDPGGLPQPAIDAGTIGVQFLQNIHLAGLPVRVDVNWFTLPDPSSADATSQAIA